jgi:glycosyltransferase involved in cell wall biosynthesis
MVKARTRGKQKTVLFYASTPSKKMFAVQRFYRTDIQILRDLGFRVKLSKNYLDFLKFWSYEIAFIYFYRYGLISALFSKIFLKKVLFTGGIDNLDLEWAGEKAYKIQKQLFLGCTFFSDCNILVSNTDYLNIQHFRPILNEKHYPRVFHAIDVNAFRNETVNGKEKIVSTIVWMHDFDNVIRKGVDKSILFFKHLHILDPEFRMVIIGPLGKGTETLLEIIRREGFESFVTFTGAISETEKISWLQKSMIYTQLSIYEGFGIAAIEALAAGNIVVHSGKGGLSDGIANFGILAENMDWETLAKVVLSKVTDTEKWSQFILQGIQHVSENFDYEVRKNAFNKIFTSMFNPSLNN